MEFVRLTFLDMFGALLALTLLSLCAQTSLATFDSSKFNSEGCVSSPGALCMDIYSCLEQKGTVYGRCSHRYGLCCKISTPAPEHEDSTAVATGSASSVKEAGNGAQEHNYLDISFLIKNVSLPVVEKQQSDSPNTATLAANDGVSLMEKNDTLEKIVSSSSHKENSGSHEYIYINNEIFSRPPPAANKELSAKLNSSTAQEICGKAVLRKGRIAGGSKASYAAWPWQVFMVMSSATAGRGFHVCGASLVNRSWLATAAHCVENIPLDKIRVTIGATDLMSDTELYPHEDRKIDKVINHPLYNTYTLDYDLALLKLDKPVSFGPNIIPICLPPEGAEEDFAGERGTITGWGRLEEGGDDSMPHLQEAHVPIMTNKECEAMFLRGRTRENIPGHFICAGHEDGRMDTCEGDSGGPLAVQFEDRWTLVGISSWGTLCGQAHQPGVYTRMSRMMDFIKRHIQY